jgi:Fe-S cluster assembly protein SufD
MSLGRAIAERDPGLLPSRRDENWRWTDLRGLLREIPPASPAAGSPATAGPFGGLADETIEIVNGRGGARQVVVGAGQQRSIALRLVSAEGAGSHISELSIRVAPGGRLVLLESHQGAGPGYVTAFALDLEVDEGASVERVVIAEDHPEGVSAVIARVSLGRGAEFGQTTLTTGARRQRLETRVVHRGETASARLDGLYKLGDRTHSDQTTVVTHEAVNCVTSQLTKGVADDQGRGVFQGRIVVSPGADGADARMGHHALILSDRAEIDAKPELEIWADDVACAHGNTVGALDEEALFYARQRGVPEADARAMLTGAFLGEVVDRIEHEGARDVARAWLEAQLS